MTRRSPLVALVAAALAGCPSQTPAPPAPATERPPPSEAPPAPAATDAGGPGPAAAGPAAGPPGLPRTPAPEEGKDQLALCETRAVTVGGVPVTVWLADTPERRELGLMHVKELPGDRGMLFIYPDVGRRRFWMRNTLVPLSLAYVREDGTIDQLVDMEPLDEATHPSVHAVRFVLEMRQGWFRERGVPVGARIEGITRLPGY